MQPSDEFRGTDRFEVKRRLGQGGYGIVYEAYDRHRRRPVALKTLYRQDPGALARLKNEFRTLAEISHPNLVSLYELLLDEGHWCITMELVEGVDFLRYVRPGARPSTDSDSTTQDLPSETVSLALYEARMRSGPSPLPPVDLERLRAALAQLARGLAFLHAHGKLHRDIKTSNVLVTPDSRVVLLDFGLAAQLQPAGPQSGSIAGTLAYMSPEQTLNQAVGPASDWYGVGVMLFEALTGRLPFYGDRASVLWAKREQDPPSAREFEPDVPDDLGQLCARLLARDPSKRLVGSAALVDLIGESIPAERSASTIAAGEPSFVGRQTELAALGEAYAASKRGRAVTVYLHGSSGIGKSALVRQFLQHVARTEPDTLILAGQCYERESVPYKALDGLVDALTAYLCRLSDSEVQAFLPRDVLALARLFPVLTEVSLVAETRQRFEAAPESQEARRRAFSAFRALLARLSDRQPLVLAIDDLQWGDADSTTLLAHVLQPPDAPAMLFIVSYRSEEVANVHLREAISSHKVPSPDGDARELTLDGLSTAEAVQLARTIVDADSASGLSSTEELLRDCKGNPFFITELVRHIEPGGEALAGDRDRLSPRASSVTLDAVLSDRIAAVSGDARRILDVLSVAGGPLAQELVEAASQVEALDIGLVATLRSERLIRVRLAGGRELFEMYHDRIREVVLGHLPTDARRGVHATLAKTLEASGRSDPETLAVHFSGAGDLASASYYALQAAQLAGEALAFDRAARLYRRALEWGLPDPALQGQIYGRLGDALASAGRGHAAGGAYLEAADSSSGEARLDLKRRAAEQFLRSGHLDEGFKAMHEVLDTLGLRVARTPSRALVSLVWGRLLLRWSGLRFRERSSKEIPSKDLLRIDTCRSVAMHIGTVDNIRGAAFQARHLRLALAAGDPYRIARAVAMQVAYSSIEGPKTARATRALSALADRLAERLDDAEVNGLVELVKGMAAYMQGSWTAALGHCVRAEALLRERRTGIAWELDTVHLYLLLSMFYLGSLTDFRRRVPAVLREAQERDDLTAETNLRVRLAYLVSLLEDDVEGAGREVVEGISRWSHAGFHAQHYFELYALTEIDVYANHPTRALRRLDQEWPALRRSLLLRVHPVFVEALSLRARTRLAVAESTGPAEREALLRKAETDAGRLSATQAAWADAMALLVRAGVAAVRGMGGEADELLRTAAATFERADMPLHRAAALWQREALSRGNQATSEEARQWFADSAVARPERLAGLLVPGFRAFTATAR